MQLDSIHETAAQLIVAGDLSFNEIAATAGVTGRTLRTWRKDVDFLARVDEIRDEYRAGVLARGIAVREHRVSLANERHQLLMRVVAERADDENLARLPGGTTGLVVITDWKKIGGGPDEEPTFVPVFELDAGLLKEFRELEKQVAQDLGQWTEKRELTGKDGGALAFSIEQAIAKAYGEEDESTGELE